MSTRNVDGGVSLLRGHSVHVAADQHTELNRVHQLILGSAQNRTKDILTRVSNEHKDIHSSVSKIGKVIDKVGLSTGLPPSQTWLETHYWV